MKNISSLHSCYGCGVCATICPPKIIDIELNPEGFYEPRIKDTARCTECGLCLSVCSFVDKEVALKANDIEYYAAWSKDNAVRRKCSSGGIGFEIGKYLINQGYKACGVRYDCEANRAEHYMADTVEAYIPSIGSKYIQSYTVSGFKELNRKDKFLVTGTPCQIDSMRRYIRKLRIEDHFVLMDFFCHGVPSMWVWKQYVKEVEKLTGKLTYVSWRNKQTGWHDSWSMGIEGEQGGEKINWHDSYAMLMRGKKSYHYFSRLSTGDLFYQFFLGNACLGKACYKNCKYKMSSSSADIRIGDLWGKAYKENEDGVSAVLALTEKGKALIKEMQEYCVFEKRTAEVVMEGQMRKSPPMPYIRKRIIEQLREGKSLFQISKTTVRLYKIACLPKRVINKIIRIIKWERK